MENTQPAKKSGPLQKLKANRHLTAWLILIIATIAVCGASLYFLTYSSRVSIDKSQITADIIKVSGKTSGSLEETFANAGDELPADTVIARVGTELIKTDVAGTIITIRKDLGTPVAAGEPVATMAKVGGLKVVGQIAEDKGLKDLMVGQTAIFTVDAFGSKKYYGTIDEISQTSHESGVTFNISDKRETKNFDVKVVYDNAAYPELKNGMSAKITVIK